MTPASRKLLVEIGKCVDLAVCGGSLVIASSLVDRPMWQSGSVQLRNPLWQLVLVLGLAFCWHISMIATATYQSYLSIAFEKQVSAILKGSVLAASWTGVWLFMRRSNARVPVGSLFIQMVLFWVLCFSGLLLLRVGARLATQMLRRGGRNRRNFLVIGTNRRAVSVAQDLGDREHSGYRLVGFVDSLWYADSAPDRLKNMLLGDSSRLLDLLRDTAVDEVIIALPIASCYKQIEQIINHCHGQGIVVRCEASLFDSGAKSLQSHQLITVPGPKRGELSSAGKRVVDIVFSACALIATLPVLIVIAIAIKLTSPGPIIFSQERLGAGKRRFRIYKFRTMVTNAEALMPTLEHLNQTQGPTFKVDRDPRVTRVGAFLRRKSLDELPQLFNVLIGDMSLVGPRPLPLRDYRGFSEDWHRRRFTVRPGITCLWQVQGRSGVGFERWMELDMDYIDNWSFWLDFKVLLQTIPAVLRGSGAM
ncbi:MAG TPA: sugar transferase [Acidisarcina sp.]